MKTVVFGLGALALGLYFMRRAHAGPANGNPAGNPMGRQPSPTGGPVGMPTFTGGPIVGLNLPPGTMGVPAGAPTA